MVKKKKKTEKFLHREDKEIQLDSFGSLTTVVSFDGPQNSSKTGKRR